MGGSMKDIKNRIKSVENTGQITKAMELVSSSKLRRAKERVEAARPYFNTLSETISEISSASKDLNSIYMNPAKVDSVLCVVIAGDRGLAGGYNSNILKLANKSIADMKAAGKKVKVIAIGKKAIDFYAKSDCELVGEYLNYAEELDQVRVRKVVENIVSRYDKSEIDQAYIYYTVFESALNQIPTEKQILPLVIANDNAKDKNKDTFYVEYEPSPEEVLDAIVPQYIGGVVYGAVVESFASEQGARRTAMESASDNASEMISTLSLQYNRARQAAITQEISEIVAGASAS